MRAVPLNRYSCFSLAAVGLRSIYSRSAGCSPGSACRVRGPIGSGGIFGFQTSLNEGALFGMGQGMVSFFASLSWRRGGYCWWLFGAGAARQWILTIALAGSWPECWAIFTTASACPD